MEGLWDKYNRIKEVFYRDFVYDSSYTEQASCIPLSSVKNGAGWVGDGTINLAHYLQFIYTEMVLGSKTEDDVRNSILVLTRLADTTYDLFFNNNKGIYFKFEKGFFLRDDIHSEDASKFGLTKIYKFQINDQRYVFMFSNRYDGMRDFINNADENVDCITSATESSIYHNDSFYIFA